MVFLFLISFLIMMLSLYIASMMKEIPIKKPKKVIDNKHYFRSMFLILKEDRNFKYYLLSVLFIGALGKMPFGFQTIFAKNSLSISTQHVAIATTILLFSQTIGYMLWGIIGSKYGFKSTLLISALMFLPAIYFYIPYEFYKRLLSFCCSVWDCSKCKERKRKQYGCKTLQGPFKAAILYWS